MQASSHFPRIVEDLPRNSEWRLVSLPVSIEDEHVHVWRVELTQSDPVVKGLQRLLNEDEKERVGRFRFTQHRARFIVARAALRQILAVALGVDPRSIEFAIGPYGKPRLTEGNLTFNLAHSGNLALIAVARGRELGIDIEEMQQIPNAASLASRFFSPQESGRITAANDPVTLMRSFVECWTIKEAFIKATGEGLSRALDSFEVILFPERKPELRVGGVTDRRWVLRYLDPGPAYCGAVVFERTASSNLDPEIVQWQWQPRYSSDCVGRVVSGGTGRRSD